MDVEAVDFFYSRPVQYWGSTCCDQAFSWPYFWSGWGERAKPSFL